MSASHRLVRAFLKNECPARRGSGVNTLPTCPRRFGAGSDTDVSSRSLVGGAGISSSGACEGPDAMDMDEQSSPAPEPCEGTPSGGSGLARPSQGAAAARVAVTTLDIIDRNMRHWTTQGTEGGHKVTSQTHHGQCLHSRRSSTSGRRASLGEEQAQTERRLSGDELQAAHVK